MKNKWFMFGVVFLSAITIMISQLKIPPVMALISESMKIPLHQVSSFMSVYTIGGIVLAIPGAAIMNKTGAKKLLIALMGCVLLGNLMGYMVNSYKLMLISRTIEGIAFAMIMMVSIYLISVWFTDGGEGLALGIFNTFAPVATFITMNLGLRITGFAGLKSLWAITSALALICIVLIFIFVKVPDNKADKNLPELKPSLLTAASNYKMWLLALSCGTAIFIMFAYMTTYPVWFRGLYGIDPLKANYYTGFIGLSGILFCIITGIILEKIGKPVIVSIAGFALMILSAFTVGSLGPGLYIPHTMLSSLSGGLAVTPIFYLAPQIAKNRQYIGYTLAFINLIYFIGVYNSTPVILKAIENSGFETARMIFIAVAAAGAVFMIIYAVIVNKEQRKQ